MIVEKWPMYLIFHIMGVGILIGIFKRTPWTAKFAFKVLLYFTCVHMIMGLIIYIVKTEFPGEWESMKPEAQDFGP
jgi:predicted membrane channel-forming protein YqfA (hemolysin III family)